MYVEKFQTTGCPNPNPDINWWKTISYDAMFQDMMNYCTIVKGGQGNEAQKTQCCGSVPCVPTCCNKVTNWKQSKILHHFQSVITRNVKYRNMKYQNYIKLKMLKRCSKLQMECLE